MLPTHFQTSLWNVLRTGRYHTPHLRGAVSHTWLLVRRCEAFLEVADAGPAPDLAPEAVPEGLEPLHSLVAIQTDATEDRADFMFVRAVPPQFAPIGAFFPCDGQLTLRTKPSSQHTLCLHLRARGRHCHSRCDAAGTITLRDVPHPPFDASGGLAWTFKARTIDLNSISDCN